MEQYNNWYDFCDANKDEKEKFISKQIKLSLNVVKTEPRILEEFKKSILYQKNKSPNVERR